MATNQAYGDGLAKRLRAENVAAAITRLRQNAIVELREMTRIYLKSRLKTKPV